MKAFEWESAPEAEKDALWWRGRWPNFWPYEFACSHCEKVMVDPAALDSLQTARTAYGRPVYIFTAYRCPDHPLERNKALGPGAHSRGNAFDPGVANLRDWLQCLFDADNPPFGFGMGLKNNSMHLHVDWDEKLGHRAWGY